MLFLLLGAIAFSVTIGVYLLAIAIYEPKERVDQRLHRAFGQPMQVASTPVPEEPFFQRVVSPLLTNMSRWMVRITPVGWRNSLRRKLLLAGNPGGLETGQFLALYLLITIVLTVLAFPHGPGNRKAAAVWCYRARLWLSRAGLLVKETDPGAGGGYAQGTALFLRSFDSEC